MEIFLCNQDNPHAQSLTQKLSQDLKPGGMTMLTDGEMQLYRSHDFKHITSGHKESGLQIHELNPGSNYVVVCDPSKTIIDDLIQVRDHLGVNMAIVRVRS